MGKDRFEMDGKIMKIAAVIGVIAAIVALAVGVTALVSMGAKRQAADDTETMPVIQEADVSDGGTMGALMVDTRSEKGEKGGSLIDLLADRQVYFAGIENATISHDTVIYLENMEENGDILMQYEITDKSTGVTLESTGLIPSGEQVAWTPGETLKSGIYTFIFHEKPFYPYGDDYVALTQGNNEVTITIE